MLGRCKVRTVGEHTTCHNGNLRSLRNLHGIHHILHRILHSHSRAQPRPHACRSSPFCIQDHNHHSLHILHGSLRIRRIRNKAQQRPQVRHRPHACRSSPCHIQDHNRHSLRIHHGSLHNLHSHSRAQPRPLACRSIPCILHSHHTHRSLRIHHIRNTARLRPLPRLQARQ